MVGELENGFRRRLDEYLTRRGIPLNKPFRCLNPKHEDRHPSMSFNRKADNVHCFSCGVTYDIFDLVGLDYGIESFSDKFNKTAQILDYTGDMRSFGRKGKNVSFVDRAFPYELEGERSEKLDYFQSRRISPEVCEKYGLFQTTMRAYFPIYENGVVGGYSARALDDNFTKPRYKNSKGAMPLWNSDILLNYKDGGKGYIFVTEGIVDALSLEELGFEAVALCGSQNGAKLISRLESLAGNRSGLCFILCGDNDDAGSRMNEFLSGELERLSFKHRDFWKSFGSSAFVDINEIYLECPDRLKEVLEELVLPHTNAVVSVSERLDEVLAQIDHQMGNYVETGFLRLDKLLDGGIYPGLYVLGSISSLGKTSFALQMADNISASGRDVLFISLEQSITELVGKSLSRLSALSTGESLAALSIREVLMGRARLDLMKGSTLDVVCEEYRLISENLYLIESIGDIAASDVRTLVREHCEVKGEPPVVFVDYLQILKTEDLRATDKQSIDRNIVELKRISRDFNTPVVAISSFNRENYKASVSMEAFKESGAVEYSADVLMGLQLQGVGESGFDLNRAKLQNPRKLELVLLKNRSGIPYAKLPLNYDAKFNLFIEPTRLMPMDSGRVK